MRIYLKQGQTVDLGEVTEINFNGSYEIKQAKYAENMEEVYGLDDYDMPTDYDRIVYFYNNKNQVFSCHQADVIAILEDRN